MKNRVLKIMGIIVVSGIVGASFFISGTTQPTKDVNTTL